MLDRGTQQRLLERYPALRDLPAALHREFVAQAASLDVPRGAVLFDERQDCKGFPLLLSGTVRVAKAAPNGRELLLYTVGAGESCILTGSCLLGQAQYQARGVAAEDLQLVILDPATFKVLVNQHEPFRSYLFALLSERMAELMQLVSAVAFQKLDQRLAALIAARRSPIHTTHQSLADELGSVREIVSRLLKHFAEQGWIRLGREQIEVVDAQALAKLGAS